jgi:proteic killer suppression protein
MIVSFRHKGLKRLFGDGDRKGVSAKHVERIENILGLLDAAEKVEDMDIPTFRLHPLVGDPDHFSLRGWQRF